MSTPDRKPPDDLIAEIKALKEASDEIRARMEATMAELEANAAELKEALKRAANSHEPWSPS